MPIPTEKRWVIWTFWQNGWEGMDVAITHITNFEKKTEIPKQNRQEMPEINNDNFKDKVVQMFSGATITGNVTVN